MATNRKKGTLAKVGAAVTRAAKAVAEKTDEYVVEPVGKALGLTGRMKAAKRPARAKKVKTTAKTSKNGKAKKTNPRKATRSK
jgi:hypothetical protein